MRPRTITFIPLSTYCSTVLPTPLKQVIRCHSVSSIRRPLSSLTTLPLLSRLGRHVARLKWVILVPPWVERARSEEHTSELSHYCANRLPPSACHKKESRSDNIDPPPNCQ